MPKEARKFALIPEAATHFAFIYPLARTAAHYNTLQSFVKTSRKKSGGDVREKQGNAWMLLSSVRGVDRPLRPAAAHCTGSAQHTQRRDDEKHIRA